MKSLKDEVCQGAGGSHHPRMAEAIHSVSEVSKKIRSISIELPCSEFVYWVASLLDFRMVDMIVKYKEEVPDAEFAEMDVMERIETKFIVSGVVEA